MKKIITPVLLIGFMWSCASSVRADASWAQWLKNRFASLRVACIEPRDCAKIAAGACILGAGIAYLWARFYSHALNPRLLSGDALLNYLRAKYRPSKERCGAAITQATDRLPDDGWAGLISLVDGHRDIYWGDQAELTPATERILNKANIGIIRFNRKIPTEFKDQHGKRYCFNDVYQQLILYSGQGKTNALLLNQYLASSSGLNCYNDYLIGTLLGYSETDIQYYYHIKEVKKSFNDDKKEALEWLAKNRE